MEQKFEYKLVLTVVDRNPKAKSISPEDMGNRISKLLYDRSGVNAYLYPCKMSVEYADIDSNPLKYEPQPEPVPNTTHLANPIYPSVGVTGDPSVNNVPKVTPTENSKDIN